MSKFSRMNDIKYFTIKKNDSYLESLYIATIGSLFTLPIALCNGMVMPFILRAFFIIKGYLTFVMHGLLGNASVLNEEEAAERSLPPTFKLLVPTKEQVEKIKEMLDGLKDNQK